MIYNNNNMIKYQPSIFDLTQRTKEKKAK